MSSTNPVLAVDIGGTKSIVGVVDRSGVVIAWRRIETPGSLGPKLALQAVTASAAEVLDQAARPVAAVGIGCGGPMDRKAGILNDVPNLPGWKGLCLTGIFSEVFGVPAFLDNDATAAAIGEAAFGAGRGIDHFVYLTISTGIGGGIIIDGRPYRGAGENAGEFGHLKVVPEGGPRCPCGDSGCLEALASGTSIARTAREEIERGSATVLADWIDSSKEVTAEMVSRAAGQGDPVASQVWGRAMDALGVGISNVVNCLNPRRVVLGGGVTRAGDALFLPVRRIVAARSMKPLAKDVEVVAAANGDLVGLMGAAALAFGELGDD